MLRQPKFFCLTGDSNYGNLFVSDFTGRGRILAFCRIWKNNLSAALADHVKQHGALQT